MERRLSAIMAADIVGYSRLMEMDELGLLARQKDQMDQVIYPELQRRNGRLVKSTGDGFLAEFPSVVDAVNCAVTFQEALAAAGAADGDEFQIRYRTGINIGDIILRDGDIFGDGVNVAARLEAIAPPGGVCISELVWQNLRGNLGDAFQDLGPQRFKNINRPVRAWKWPAEAGTASHSASSRTDATQNARLLLDDITCRPQDGEANDFADGLIRDLDVTLSKLDTLSVVCAGSKWAESARYLLGGDARSAGARLRCNIQLREAETGRVLWAERFDGSLEDVFSFQDQITETVAVAIETELSDGQQVLRWRQEAGNTHAYEQFLEGRSAYKEYSRSGNARAKVLFQKALAEVPGFLSASVGLARTHIEDAHFGWSGDKRASLDQAQEILDGVLAINPEHSAAHAEVSHLHMIAGDFQRGLLAAEFAVALDPNDADAHNVLSYLLNCVWRYEDALLSARRALSLNPSGPEFYLLPMLQANLALGRYSEAVSLSDRILAKRPFWLTTHVLKVLALDGAGREHDAKNALAEMLFINPRFTIGRWKKTLHNPEEATLPGQVAVLQRIGMPE